MSASETSVITNVARNGKFSAALFYVAFLGFPQKLFQFSAVSSVVCLTFLVFKYCEQSVLKAGNAFRFLLRKLLGFLHFDAKKDSVVDHLLSWLLSNTKFYIFIEAKFQQFVSADHTPNPILFQPEYIHGMYTNLCKCGQHTIK